jgi:hypothetical protein
MLGGFLITHTTEEILKNELKGQELKQVDINKTWVLFSDSYR